MKKKLPSVIHIEIDFEQKISRWFIVRFLWVPVIVIPLLIFTIWYGILEFVHFFYMLLWGKRDKDIFLRQLHYIRYAAGWQVYLSYYTNGHPPVLPWEMTAR